ncbi:HTH domain-containing protein [Epilithonimonas tenax]|uniref:HTH domain-containing protein n=1 Tax=Epilithonimonas tenax TaxID=191577 RepID=UPI000485A9CD|nr:HTH domain-containing protein [Epilithonimonas tenax]
MATDKSVQKFTETQNKINRLMELDKVTPNDYKDFTKDELKQLDFEIQDRMNNVQGEEKENFLVKIDAMLSVDTKNQLWEQNHSNIMWAISVLTEENYNLPPVNAIAQKLNLSRTTVHKHIKAFKEHSSYKAQQESIEMMADKIVWQMYRLANNGDVKAGRLFLEVAGKIGKPKQQTNNTQNNYIQINGMVFNDEKLKTLKPEQLKSIETILLTANLEQPLFEDAEIIQKKEV